MDYRAWSFRNREVIDRGSRRQTDTLQHGRISLSACLLSVYVLWFCSCCASSFPSHTVSCLSLPTAVSAESNYLKVKIFPPLLSQWTWTILFKDRRVQTNFGSFTSWNNWDYMKKDVANIFFPFPSNSSLHVNSAEQRDWKHLAMRSSLLHLWRAQTLSFYTCY